MALIICWKWEAFHWVSCVRTRAVMYVCFCICLARWTTSSTYWFPKARPEKPSNKSLVWLIHNTNFGLICTQRLRIWSSSKIAPVEIQFLSNPTHSFSVSQNFNAFFKLPIRPSSKRGIWGPIAFSHRPPLRCQAFRWNYHRGFCHSVAIGWVAALYNSCKAHMNRHQQVCVCERDKERVKGSERGGGTSRLMFNTKWDCLHLLPQEP